MTKAGGRTPRLSGAANWPRDSHSYLQHKGLLVCGQWRGGAGGGIRTHKADAHRMRVGCVYQFRHASTYTGSESWQPEGHDAQISHPFRTADTPYLLRSHDPAPIVCGLYQMIADHMPAR